MNDEDILIDEEEIEEPISGVHIVEGDEDDEDIIEAPTNTGEEESGGDENQEEGNEEDIDEGDKDDGSVEDVEIGVTNEIDDNLEDRIV